MTEPFQLIDPIANGQQWDVMIAEFSGSSFFHSSAWAATLIGAYSFRPFYCAWFNSGNPAALLPIMQTRTISGKRRGVSLPFSDSCEPLFKTPDDFRKTFDRVIQLGSDIRWNCIEFRGGKHLLGKNPHYEEIYTHDIDLDRSEKEILKSFRDSTQRNIRAAEKRGVEVTHSNSLGALQDFYRLNCLTRREHGIPPQPWAFFRHFWSTVLKREMGFISSASFKGKVTAANVYLIYGKKALYKYGASDHAYQQLRPSNMVMWEGAKKCRTIGCTSLNLGRTEKCHEGLLQYKRGFGCKETMINYYRFDMAQKRFVNCRDMKKQYSITHRVFSKLPIPLLRLVGDGLYKYIG
jgi:hypothetical protein